MLQSRQERRASDYMYLIGYMSTYLYNVSKYYHLSQVCPKEDFLIVLCAKSNMAQKTILNQNFYS